MHEHRLRHYWHKQCESGRRINLEVEAGKTNEAIMDYCRTRIDGVLQAAGLSPNGAPQAAHQPRQDDQASAVLKQEANLAQERRRFQVAANAFKQKQATHEQKIQAFKDSEHQQLNGKRFFNSGNAKNNKGWNNHRGQSKGHS